jgi:hypothetical protein
MIFGGRRSRGITSGKLQATQQTTLEEWWTPYLVCR